MREGCPNCDPVLGLRDSSDAIQECTSQVFEGLITIRDPTSSWVARWQGLDKYVPGTYAVKVTGTVCISYPILFLYSIHLLANERIRPWVRFFWYISYIRYTTYNIGLPGYLILSNMLLLLC